LWARWGSFWGLMVLSVTPGSLSSLRLERDLTHTGECAQRLSRCGLLVAMVLDGGPRPQLYSEWDGNGRSQTREIFGETGGGRADRAMRSRVDVTMPPRQVKSRTWIKTLVVNPRPLTHIRFDAKLSRFSFCISTTLNLQPCCVWAPQHGGDNRSRHSTDIAILNRGQTSVLTLSFFSDVASLQSKGQTAAVVCCVQQYGQHPCQLSAQQYGQTQEVGHRG